MTTIASTLTSRQLAVMRAAVATLPPYEDELRRRCDGLSDAEFDEAVRRLTAAGMLRRCTAPRGVLLYPVVRSADSWLVRLK